MDSYALEQLREEMHMNSTIPLSTGPSRTMFLGDVEALAGKSAPTCSDVKAISVAVHKVFGHLEPVCVLACAHYNAPAIWFHWSGARYLVRSGKDGADKRLIQVVEDERVAERFGIIIIGSSDGIFARTAAQLASAGVYVIGAYGKQISNKLRLAVHETVRLPIDWKSLNAAAAA
jgi:hypothetical protein